jgi:predicted  nucleic acid-binding Zn-ribbon protein
MRTKLTASLLLLSVFSTAHATKIILKSGDWIAADNGSCVLYSDVGGGLFGGNSYRIMFTKPKKNPGPTDINILMTGSNNPKSLNINLQDDSVLSFADMGPTGQKKQTSTWYIPQNTASLISQLENGKDIKVLAADGSRDPNKKFSADGFKRVKDKLEEVCLNRQPVYDLAFEDSFILKRDSINVASITPDQVKELKKSLNAGYSVHLAIVGTRGDLMKLQGKFQNQLTEQQNLIARIDNLGNREIPGIIQSQQQNDGLEANSRSQLDQTNVTISQQRSQLSGAQSQLTTARNVIAPFEAEHADRESRAVSARRSVNDEGARLSDIDNSMRASQARINELSSEAGQLQNQNSRLENDLRYARQNRARAEMDSRNYRPREEATRRLQADALYQSARRELPGIQNSIQIVENALNDAKGKLLARQTELRVCQSKTSLVENMSTERIPAQEHERRPRPDGDRPHRPRPDGDQTPTNPEPTPAPTQPTPAPTPTDPAPSTTSTAPDCTSQINAVNQAQQVVATLENQRKDSRSRLEDVQRRITQIEARVDNEVARIDADLRDRATVAARQENNLLAQISVNNRRLEVIANVEIPQQQNSINQLSNERPAVQSRYNQDAPLANRLEGELSAFERRVGWDAKVDAVNSAESLLAQRSNDLNRSLSQKQSLETQINRCQQDRTSLAADLVDAQNRKLQAENRLQVVTNSLVPYEQEKSRLEQHVNDLKGQLASQAQDFESKLP